MTDNSQQTLIFRLPTQTGFSNFQWPYIYNSNNVNLSSTNGQTISIASIEETNPNDYFLKSTSFYQQKASSFTVDLNNYAVNVKNVYTNPDTIYHFPLVYKNSDSSHGLYTITVPPNLYYQNVIINRKDTVNGWGNVITPYGTFSNCLKSVSNILEVDSIAVDGKPLSAIDTIYSRELEWFDPSKPYPVLTVTEDLVGNSYVPQSIQYLDVQKYFQPTAFFGYFPLSPNMGDTVTFQNLSTNAQSYQWYFADTSSGSNDSSTAINPQHIFANPGTYDVTLIAFNGPLEDTFMLAIVVNPINIIYTFNGNGNWSDTANWSNNSVPPSTLPATNAIVINPVAGGQCYLDITQHISSGASLTVISGKTFVIPGFLYLQ